LRQVQLYVTALVERLDLERLRESVSKRHAGFPGGVVTSDGIPTNRTQSPTRILFPCLSIGLNVTCLA
jgi:hypothetical protein